jgi:hypothetical protein
MANGNQFIASPNLPGSGITGILCHAGSGSWGLALSADNTFNSMSIAISTQDAPYIASVHDTFVNCGEDFNLASTTSTWVLP